MDVWKLGPVPSWRIFSCCLPASIGRNCKAWDVFGELVKSEQKKTEETRQYISSKDFEVQDFSEAVRGHWGIENSLHWVMDIVFRNDECRARKKNASANFVILKHIHSICWKACPARKVWGYAGNRRVGTKRSFMRPFSQLLPPDIHAIALGNSVKPIAIQRKTG